MIQIKEVNDKKTKKLFAVYPLQLYKNCPYYVPSLLSDELGVLNPKKNGSLKNTKAKAFLCYKEGKLVGRALALIPDAEKDKVRFSRIDAVDDIEVFRALICAVEKFGLENGAEYIQGPWGFNDTDREGLLTYGFDRESTYATAYSYPYYAKHIKELGFLDQSKWVEYKFNIPKVSYERIDNLAIKLKEKYKLKDLAETMPVTKIREKYGDAFFETLIDGYSHLDGFVPLNDASKKDILDQFVAIINLRYVSFLVDEKDRVAGFGICLPSITQALIKHRGRLFPFGFIDVLKAKSHPKKLEMALISVRSEYKNSGINAILISRIVKNIIADGITAIESNPMSEKNDHILQMWKFSDSEIVKKRQTFIKKIGV
jgi:hypothetical protein